jgi:hypothetical protein
MSNSTLPTVERNDDRWGRLSNPPGHCGRGPQSLGCHSSSTPNFPAPPRYTPLGHSEDFVMKYFFILGARDREMHEIARVVQAQGHHFGHPG